MNQLSDTESGADFDTQCVQARHVAARGSREERRTHAWLKCEIPVPQPLRFLELLSARAESYFQEKFQKVSNISGPATPVVAPTHYGHARAESYLQEHFQKVSNISGPSTPVVAPRQAPRRASKKSDSSARHPSAL